MKDKSSILFVLLPVVAVVILAVVAVVVSRGPAVPQEEALLVRADDHVKGSAGAPVTIIEFADFQCPGCAGFAPLVSQLQQQYGEDLRVVFRHFPLTSIHQNAIVAAQAAEAASMQGKFWEMHDKLFTGQQTWAALQDPLTVFRQYAEELELHMDTFEKDYASTEVQDRIRTDLRMAQSFGLTGTPTFFVNGEQIETPSDYASFSAIIDKALGGDQAAVEVPVFQVKEAN
ncbi:MAG: thioredoxin domain-containing protein [Candidatus Magasanikbacteria bacterium]|uniref:Disulfide bond formation protein DsbA n=1 Tax=Candidatus Magasanikbacteria bacterium CG10_big_fil_rev_8_21_14_0_10_38_6 TaxID=1974647 RepID=A0A2M6P2H1_9BACT|nr:thioredoxin domain-containing protein [Candidatus Magasanikbacteria bacterium]PIR77887.1 MAG: disulfide bond formation protein DsbA [Candidatus Magasanikbacteria bacterium CG10_big_fil_rev_8_21_14_0_10_38_6]